MRNSSTTARIVTGLIGLLVTPVAIGLVFFGGLIWLQRLGALSQDMPPADLLTVRVLLQLLGLLLLAGVVVTGIWSSAGLIAAGVLSLVPIAAALFPAVLLEIYRAAPSAIRPAVDALTYGHALLLLVAMGAGGIALALARRAPAGGEGGIGVLGLVLAPLLLALSAWLLPTGLASGQLEFLRTYRTEPQLLSILAVLAGVALLVTAVLLTRWSSWALILPAALLLLGTVPTMVPEMLRMLPRDLYTIVVPLLVTGGGVAMAVVFVVHAFVIAKVRRSAAPAAPDAADPAAYPVAA
ncbi:MAG: hypothetical protein LBU78_11195 [Microbacterium sp.]|jgi:hypothetical protein|nr:hypothetical protein [Microbacterium sp.]